MTEVVVEFAAVALRNCGLGEQTEDTEIGWEHIYLLIEDICFKPSKITLRIIL